MGPMCGTTLGLVILVVLSEGKPQIDGDATNILSPPVDPSTSVVSPWSQWMSLKAPPIPGLPMGGGSKKKKLLPGPPPPEGTPESPWVSWTRMKISSALAPPLPLPPSPPSPIDDSSSNATSSAGEPTVWIQWTQMKLPLTNPLTPPGSVAETPWDAWTKVKSPMAQVSPDTIGSPPTGLVRRMAPDRYIIASTVAPNLSGWPPATLSSQQNGQISTVQSRVALSPPQVGPQSSIRPTYMDVLNATPSIRMPSTQTFTQFQPTSLPQSQVSMIPSIPFRQTLPAALWPIPHQLVSQIVSKATPEELTQVILAVSQAQDDKSSPDDIPVQQLLPSTLIAKLSDELTPLLDTPIKISPPTASISDTPAPPELAAALSPIPEPVRTAIISNATPQELIDVISTVTKLEAVPPAEQGPVANVPVAAILPPSLQAKVPAASSVKLVPPILLTLPPEVVNAILPLASPSEVSVLVANAAKLETMPSIVPRPPLGALLPPSLVSKAPPHIAPLLAKPVPTASPPPQSIPISPVTNSPAAPALNALPAPLPQIILEKATLPEIEVITNALSVLEVAVPLASIVQPPPAAAVIPQTLLPKLPPQLLPLLAQPIALASSPPTKESTVISKVFAAVPPTVLKQIVIVATPEELAEIKENLIAPAPVTASIVSLLPASLVAKLPPPVLPALNKVVAIPAVPLEPVPTTVALPTIPGIPPQVMSTVTTALSKLPAPVLTGILKVATPAEVSAIAEIVSKLETAPPAEKLLISKLEVGTILPPALVAKLPAAVLPLLSAPVVVPNSPAALPTPLPVIPGIPSKIVEAITNALSDVPTPAVTKILTTATSSELAAIVDAITKLESLPPAEARVIEQFNVEAIIPESLLSKLPPSLVELLKVPIKIIPHPPTAVAPIPSIPGVPPSVVATIVPALTAVPPPVVAGLLSVATPAELAEVAETIAKLEALPPSEIPLIEKIEVETILPSSLLAKLPPSILPLVRVPVTIPKMTPLPITPSSATSPPETIPLVPGVPQNVVATILPALAVVPPSVVSEILSVGTPSELTEVAETIGKLEALAPSEISLTEKIEVETILPSSLVAKLPPSLVPLLGVPVTITPLAPIPGIPGVPPSVLATIVPALTAVPPPLVSEILAVATPAELAEIAETIAKLEALPPAEMKLAEKIEVETILPPSLVAKLPPALLPLINVPVNIPTTPTALVSPPATMVPGVPPNVVATILSALAVVPPSVVTEILSVATPAELAEVAETITKLEQLPAAEIQLVEKIEVETILPSSLVAKLPPSLVPLLSVPVTITPVAPIPIIPGVPPSVVATIVPALTAVPPPVVAGLLSVATLAELAEVAETIAKLEALPPSEIPLIEKIEVGTILPPSLLAKLPPSILPLVSVPVTISTISPPPITPATPVPPSKVIPAVPGVPPTLVAAVATALSLIPPPVVSQILSAATPAELTVLAETISKLEALPPSEKPFLATLEVESILPPSFLAKLPPLVIPFLAKPVTLAPPAPAVVPPVPTTIPGLPPSITSVAVPPLSALPPPVIAKILTSATPSELAQIVDTALKLGALSSAEKATASVLDVGAMLPPSLVAKLPPPIVSLLSAPVKVPGLAPPAAPTPAAIPPIPGVPPAVLNTIVSAISALPPPVANALLTAATPAELSQLAEAITELEAVPPPQLPLVSALPIETVIPEPLLARLPPQVASVLATTVLKIVPPSPAVEPLATLPPFETTEPLPAAEQKVLTKWAKVILEKTGKPAVAPIPGEIPPLQAAWMEWIQLKVNTSKVPTATTVSPAAPSEQPTTEYPWTQWLKLKVDTTTIVPGTMAPPLLDVATESPEKEILDWLESLEKATEETVVTPVTPSPELPVSPETEAIVAEALKDLGIEIVDLQPEQIKALLVEVEKNIAAAAMSPALVPEVAPPATIPGVISPAAFPFVPYVYSPAYWPPTPYLPLSPLPSTFLPQEPDVASLTPTALSPSPTLNLTEYLISNSIIPAETSPSAPIPIPTLTKLITDNYMNTSMPSTVTAEELGSLTPTKFAALLKQILQDCRFNDTLKASLATRSVKPSPYASYYKNKYSPTWRGKRSPSPALYPIPNKAFFPTTTAPSFDPSSLPLPKLDTSGTVLDPAYWAAQKSMFLSQLFSTLAKVALNDSNAAGNKDVTTISPRQELAKQVNTALLSDMTRSVHHHPPKKQKMEEAEEDSSEDQEYDYQEDQPGDEQNTQENDNSGQSHDFNQKEKELVSNDNSEPDLPKEPENPLHKLFKFGIQKTVLSDLSTPSPVQQPVYIYVTPDPSSYYPITMTTPIPTANYMKAYHQNQQAKSKKKKRPQKQQSHRNKSQHQFNRKPTRFRSHSQSTTTENPVDFELLAKALLLDDATGNGPKRATGGRN